MNQFIKQKSVFKIGVIMCFIVFSIVTLRELFHSAFFRSKNRLNLLIYAEKPVYLSIEKGGSIHYAATYDSDSRTQVPGGYGIYRIGALEKMVQLEKQPELLLRTFSRITGSMIDFYFYPGKNVVYYGNKETLVIPSIYDIFLYRTNASFFDRLYVVFLLLGKKDYMFTEIYIDKKIVNNNMVLLSDTAFQDKYLGFFYDKQLRQENKTIQILYSKSYGAATTISRIIDGEGMRVVDIDKLKNGKYFPENSCTIIEEGSKPTQTALRIASFFSCRIIQGKTRLSDIILQTGTVLESKWE